MKKLEVGDTVRLVSSAYGPHLKRGDTGVVSSTAPFITADLVKVFWFRAGIGTSIWKIWLEKVDVQTG